MNSKQFASLIASVACLIEATEKRERVEALCAYLLKAIDAFCNNLVPEPLSVAAVTDGRLDEDPEPVETVLPAGGNAPLELQRELARLNSRIVKLSKMLPDNPDLEDTIEALELRVEALRGAN